jgi:large subunit ribosomal protein L23
MALFGLKKDEKKEPEKPKIEVKPESVQKPAERKSATKSVTRGRTPSRSLAWVLKRQRITEKASLVQEGQVYAFEVAVNANKRQIADAVEVYYKVRPVKVHTINRRAKKFFSRMRGRSGMVTGYKIAYVYLKKGESIEII